MLELGIVMGCPVILVICASSYWRAQKEKFHKRGLPFKKFLGDLSYQLIKAGSSETMGPLRRAFNADNKGGHKKRISQFNIFINKDIIIKCSTIIFFPNWIKLSYSIVLFSVFSSGLFRNKKYLISKCLAQMFQNIPIGNFQT